MYKKNTNKVINVQVYTKQIQLNLTTIQPKQQLKDIIMRLGIKGGDNNVSRGY